jgi:hypothetical protein
MAQAFGIVYVLISRETTENGLPQQSDKSMPAILAGSRIHERVPYRAEAKRVVEFAIDNGRDRARRGPGGCVASALRGAFQLRLGEPPGTHLHWDDHLRCGGCRRADRAEPAGASCGTSPAIDQTV